MYMILLKYTRNKMGNIYIYIYMHFQHKLKNVDIYFKSRRNLSFLNTIISEKPLSFHVSSFSTVLCCLSYDQSVDSLPWAITSSSPSSSPVSGVSHIPTEGFSLFAGSFLFPAPSWALASPSPLLRHIHMASTATGWPLLPWVFRLEVEPASLRLLFYPGLISPQFSAPQSLFCFVLVSLNSAVPPTHHFFALLFPLLTI